MRAILCLFRWLFPRVVYLRRPKPRAYKRCVVTIRLAHRDPNDNPEILRAVRAVLAMQIGQAQVDMKARRP